MNKLLAEFLGTFFFCAVALLSGNPLAAAGALAVTVYALGYVSGGHFNPAVSLAVWLRGQLDKGEMLRFWGAQAAGAVTAFLIYKLLGSSHDVIRKLETPAFRALLGETGFTFLVAFTFLIFRGLMIAADAPTLFSRLVAGAITLSFFTYAFVNMGMVSGILPVVGVPLPFVSYGGTAMVSLGLALEPVDWSGLSLAVGISLAEALEPGNPTRPAIRLKWPNDLWLTDTQGERKLAGILVETSSWAGQRYVVIGVGINISAAALAAVADASGTSASNLSSPNVSPMPPAALQELVAGIDAPAALLRVVAPLVQMLQAFAQFGFAPFQSRFARRDVLAGRSVSVFDGKNALEGSAFGVGVAGALLVHTADGMKEITSSEVSVRPVVMRRPVKKHKPPC